MKFSTFIKVNLDQIVAEWEVFAHTLMPAAKTMSDLALRNHSRDILLAIAKDMETTQTKHERSDKSKHMRSTGALQTAAAAHGALRQIAGFDLTQLVGEFRAMRASVLAMWRRSDAADSGDQTIEEIARFNEGIDQALAESVERYSSDIATFLAVVGHDLRSPLWAIQGSIEILSSTVPSETTRSEAMTRIRRSTKAMGVLISDLLEYTGAQFGLGITIHRTSFDLGAACADAIDTVKGIYPERDFPLFLSGDLVIKADAPRMRQVLWNLLSNAVQHGDAEAAVSLSASAERDEIVLKVANLGPSIPIDALHTIFDPLVRLPTGKSEPHEHPYTGLGMGLFIVREIINRHHGTVTVASDAETVFTVRLPRVGNDADGG